MKYALFIVLFLFAGLMTLAGAMFKIMHWPGARILLTLGLLFQAVSVIGILIKALREHQTSVKNSASR